MRRARNAADPVAARAQTEMRTTSRRAYSRLTARASLAKHVGMHLASVRRDLLRHDLDGLLVSASPEAAVRPLDSYQCRLRVSNIYNGRVGNPWVIRESKQIRREQQPLLKRIKMLLLFSKPLEWLDRRYYLRRYLHDQSDQAGRHETVSETKRRIDDFVKK